MKSRRRFWTPEAAMEVVTPRLPFAICDGCKKRRRVHRWRGRLDLCVDCSAIRTREERRAEGSAVKRRTDSRKRA
jgi:hypothetical protein